jgi:uncharacterized protein (UPF0335 family)
MTKTIWEREQLDPTEAAEKFLGYVREVKRLDDENETISRQKAATFKSARSFGFTPAAIKEIARPTFPEMVDTDEKALRHYIRLTAGDDAARAMTDASQFGAILFGDADAWPTDGIDCD